MTERKPIVLVVDDAPENIELLVGCLRDSYKVRAARSGEAALKVANAAEPPDLILLDIMMPGMDGYEVCSRLKSKPDTAQIPVIFVSGLTESVDEAKGLALGAVDYITKPISPPIVEARVRTHLALRRAMKDLQSAYDSIEVQKRRMQSELDVGHEIQMSMLPTAFPRRVEFDVHACVEPAREVGGDFYDCFLAGPDCLCICVADVSDKGVPSALLMAVTKTMIRVRADAVRSPAAILDYVNSALRDGNDACMFVTIYLAMLDLRTGVLVSCNAAHNPPLLRRGSGEVTPLTRRDGSVVGSPLNAGGYTESRIVLAQGDTLLLYTDGVTEAEDPTETQFGTQRLHDLLGGDLPDSMESLVHRVLDEAKAFESGRPQTDDRSVVALRFLGTGDSSTAHFETTVPNALERIQDVSAGFEAFAEEQGIPEAVRQKVHTAIDELLSNAIRYAFDDDATHLIGVGITYASSGLELRVSDDGRRFDPFRAPPPQTDLPVMERPEGGLGIHILRRLFDRSDYQRQGNRNVVTLELRNREASVQ
jgi:sigma-B regulation protein RsbU (phosphoserine phosphatase)